MNKQILVASLCSMMTLSFLGSSTSIVHAEDNLLTETTETNDKIYIDDISFFYQDLNNLNFVDSENIFIGGDYNIEQNKSNELFGKYHFKWENLTPDLIDMLKPGELSPTGPQIVIDSKDTGTMKFTNVYFKTKQKGIAKIKCTYNDIENTSSTKTEIFEINIKELDSNIPDEEIKEDITINSSNDILNNGTSKEQAINVIKNATTSATINLNLTNTLDKITLPSDILQEAKNKNIPLTINVDNNGFKTTWTFANIDNVLDINLSMEFKESSNLGISNSLIFNFNHSGKLPTGTTVKTYVGHKFKAGDKVTFSYYNEATKELENGVNYVVDTDGFISVVVNHCSEYVLSLTEKEDNNVSTDETTADLTKNDVKKVDVPQTGDMTNLAYLFTTMLASSGSVVYILKKKK